MSAPAQARALLVGTRRSALALAQAGQIARTLTSPAWTDQVLVPIAADGDEDAPRAPGASATGVFVGTLRRRLMDGDIDVAVHSMKDLPTAPEPGLVIAAIPLRCDPRDALVSRHENGLAGLPPGARVGTGSPRRAAQILALGRSWDVVPIRGNVDSRLRMVDEGMLDAVVVASAGLTRLGLRSRISEALPPEVMMPAPAQGALALECRAGDAQTIDAVRLVDDLLTRAAVTAERDLLRTLEGGCTAPIGALAHVTGSALTLRAVVASTDGSHLLSESATGSWLDAARLGQRLGQALLARGAAALCR